ncbi:hypothetical protein [Desulfovirgula thermocuniculi]|uniref:hypothetical protein n=1 Tax=Desulfovirgula thermocuniculi TaxID=348842 RepID=UPI00040CCF94|nr:hypothetical protein [Desulfovirgula thermocuniculi]
MSFWERFWGGSGEGGLPPKKQRQQAIFLGGLAALGVLLLLLGHLVPLKGPQAKNGQAAGEPRLEHQELTMAHQEAAIEEKLREMLGQVEGAGRVKVTVRLASSNLEEYAVNTTTSHKTTQEKDQAGGTRVTSENTSSDQLVLFRTGQGEKPVVKQEVAARIAGVLVVADGARDPVVKDRLFRAVQVALGIEPHKVMVLPRERGEI